VSEDLEDTIRLGLLDGLRENAALLFRNYASATGGDLQAFGNGIKMLRERYVQANAFRVASKDSSD
jgi:hypothetical protein